MAKQNDFKLWTTLYQSSTNCICYNNFALFICFKNQILGKNLMFLPIGGPCMRLHLYFVYFVLQWYPAF